METAAAADFTLNLAQRDKRAVWHPFTQVGKAKEMVGIVKARGAYLFSEDGKSYLDAISSWWVNLHGHGHPYIIQKMKEQLELLQHTLFVDFTHIPAVQLAERLLALLPGEMGKIFYSDNGSTAIETALKMVFQFWHHQEPFEKRKVICFKGGFHGDTFGAMSAAGRNEFNRPFWNYLFEVEMIDPPFEGLEERSINQLELMLSNGKAACFLFEPLILGLGGRMMIYSAAALSRMVEICRLHRVITIADEVMTGFGRVGPLFASERLSDKPDMICLSKSITGGYLPLGATACKEFIFEAFRSKDLSRAFLHGHSYTGNPLACSAALASLDLLEKEKTTKQRKMIEESHLQFCAKRQGHASLKRCESLGTILVVEYALGESSSYFHSLRDCLYDFFLERGVLVRPLGNVLYLLPPYCVTEKELAIIYGYIDETLEKLL